MLQKISVSNKSSFELSFHQRILKKSVTISTILSSSTTVFNIDNNQNCVLSSKPAY